MQQSIKFRRPVFVTVLALVALLAASLVATGASTAKSLSTNFTLVNLNNGANTVSINYYKPDGSQWRPSESTTLATQGAQVIRRQYEDAALSAGSGSVVVGGSGPMGAVVQILARGQVPTSGAYSGATSGAASFNVPLVARNSTGASGTVNSQIIVQNTGGAATSFTISLIDGNGTTVRTTPAVNLNPGASSTYDLADDGALPAGFYSAVVNAAAGGQVAVVSNLFTGNDAMQTFSGFATGAQKWLAPLFTSRLLNGLSTPVSVQNLSGGAIPAGGIKLNCIADPSSGKANFNLQNDVPVGNTASFFFNPVTNNNIPSEWFGACTVDTTGFNTVAFVQMRTVGTQNAAAYEAISAAGTKTKVIVPLYMKRLANGFATAVTIQNLGAQAATVNISYKQGDGAPANCNVDVNGLNIPVGGSLIQYHRLANGPNSVPSLPEICFGSMIVKSTNGQPIEAKVLQ
jgi:hypothetical protein